MGARIDFLKKLKQSLEEGVEREVKQLRDINRIEVMLYRLQKVWLQCPDERLGQLIYNLGREYMASKNKTEVDIFTIEDTDMLGAINKRLNHNTILSNEELYELELEEIANSYIKDLPKETFADGRECVKVAFASIKKYANIGNKVTLDEFNKVIYCKRTLQSLVNKYVNSEKDYPEQFLGGLLVTVSKISLYAE